MRLGITGNLATTLCSTNPCESMIEIVRYTQRNVKRWQDGDMRKRWTAAGMLVAEQQFRRIIGYRDLATLVIAIERHAPQPPRQRSSPSQRSPSSLPSDRQPEDRRQVPRRSGHPRAAAGFGQGGKPSFWIEARGRPVHGRLHVAFEAKSRNLVDAFHAAAIAAGGIDNGAPGVRDVYHPNYYGAYVLDPDGNNIEAVSVARRRTTPNPGATSSRSPSGLGRR